MQRIWVWILMWPLGAAGHQFAPPPAPWSPPAAAADALPPLALGGYFQPGFIGTRDTPFDTQDRDGFVIFNARLTGKGTAPIADDVSLGLRFNFDVGGGTFAVRDLYGSLLFFDGAISLDVGQLKVPFMLAERTSESRLQFPVHTPVRTRTRQIRGAGLSQSRDRGVRLIAGRLFGAVWLGAELGLFNGEGQNAVQNQDDEYLYAGRIEVGPLGRMTHDEPDLEDSDPQFAFGLSGSVTPSVASRSQGVGDTGAEDVRFAADMRLKFRGFSLRGEFVRSDQDGADAQDITRYGVYAQMGYVLPFDMAVQLEPVIRWAQYDNNDRSDGISEVATAGGVERRYDVPDNTEIRMIDLGLNTYFAGHRLKLMVMYRLTDFLEGPETDEGLRELVQTGALGGRAGEGTVLIGDAVYTMLQFGWL